jgi:hypothetical protein
MSVWLVLGVSSQVMSFDSWLQMVAIDIAQLPSAEMP